MVVSSKLLPSVVLPFSFGTEMESDNCLCGYIKPRVIGQQGVRFPALPLATPLATWLLTITAVPHGSQIVVLLCIPFRKCWCMHKCQL